MKRAEGRFAAFVLVAVVVAGIAVGAVFSAGCGSSTMSVQQYKDQWADVIDPFETKVAKDDQKANDLVAKGDLAAVIALLKARIANVDETFDRIAAFRPPPEMRNLQAITLYYLFAVKQQLQAQNNLNDAIRKGEPTTDLAQIADNAKARTIAVTRELILELEQQGIKLKVMEEQPTDQSGSAPVDTAPASAPQ